MFPQDPVRDPQIISTQRALIASTLCALLSLIGYMVAPHITGSGIQSTVYSLSSVLLSVGLVGFGYELAIRRALAHELMELVQVERSVTKNRVRRVGDASRIDWPTVLEPASVIRVLLPDPAAWVQANWSSILHGGRERPIQVEFVFPDPEGRWLERVAVFRNLEEHQLSDSVQRAIRLIEDQWKAARDANKLASGSSIAVRVVDRFPTYPIVKADSSLIVVLYRSTKHPPADHGFAIQFSGEPDEYPLEWFHHELNDVADSPAVYEGTIEED